MSADGALDPLDGDDAYGLTAQYDLGGGATVNGGVFQAYKHALDQADDTIDWDNPTIADFGIVMSF